jgi:ABC-type phosphate transport system substrate-binding protein
VTLCALMVLTITAWCVASPPVLTQTARPNEYRIIVHPKNPMVTIEREFAAQSFLKKVSNWSHGGVIRPVDLSPDSPVRRKFSEEVVRRSVSAVRSYWLQVIFSGRGVPPPELQSDDDVVYYVLREPGAIGYVSGHAELRGARTLLVQ